MDILIMCKFIEFYDSNIKKKFVLKIVLIFSDFQILRFSDSQILRFSDFTMGVPAKPSGFPLYLCSRPRIPPPLASAKDAAAIPNALGAAVR